MRVTTPTFVREAMRALFVDAPDPLGRIAIRHAVDPEWVEGDGRFYARLPADAADDRARGNLLCLTSLGVYAEHTGQPLRTALDPAVDTRLRVSAVSFLLRCRPRHTQELVGALLDEGERTVVRAGVAALSRSGNTQAHGSLRERAPRPGHGWLIDLCPRLFSQVSVPACRGRLRTVRTERCGERDGARFRRSLYCSAVVRDTSVLPLLGDLLHRPGPAGLVDRVLAYRSPARLEHPRPERVPLRALEAEDDAMAAVHGIEALGTLRTRRAEEALLSYLDPATWPSSWPERSPDPGQGEQRPSDQRVLAAAVALARTGTSRAAGPLAQLSDRPSESPGLRRVAYEALRTLRYHAESEREGAAEPADGGGPGDG